MAEFTIDDIINLEPSKVSRDLSGYITYIYGDGGVGKTTLAKDMQALILACEDGTHAMSGAYAKIMKSWSDIRTIGRFLKDKRMKARYKAVAIDTVDIAAAYCEKYICAQHDVDKLGQVPYGGGWSAFKKEFEEVFRNMANEGYAILFISHSKEKTVVRPDGSEFTKIVPTVSDSINNIVRNMSDIQGYGYQEYGTDERYLVLRSNGAIEAKSRFPYIDQSIPFSYTSLTEALNRAIDEEELHSGPDAITTKKVAPISTPVLDYDTLIADFNNLIRSIPGSTDMKGATEEGQYFASYYAPKIKTIVETHLGGKGKTVSGSTRGQEELIAAIIDEIKDTFSI